MLINQPMRYFYGRLLTYSAGAVLSRHASAVDVTPICSVIISATKVNLISKKKKFPKQSQTAYYLPYKSL